MYYQDLHDLINHSSSSRQYFLAQSIDDQIILHQYNHHIHSLWQLHYFIENIDKLVI
ncbi:hypothetical protein [Thomasclavelia sp.]|uniref:hypothetical protein n=1 Tax=Thomasclavelia sp. TaxID=3025757 RepID=UPI0025E18A3D|nr:hypothetical protein [Thomasclavelia sp.]